MSPVPPDAFVYKRRRVGRAVDGRYARYQTRDRYSSGRITWERAAVSRHRFRGGKSRTRAIIRTPTTGYVGGGVMVTGNASLKRKRVKRKAVNDARTCMFVRVFSSRLGGEQGTFRSENYREFRFSSFHYSQFVRKSNFLNVYTFETVFVALDDGGGVERTRYDYGRA